MVGIFCFCSPPPPSIPVCVRYYAINPHDIMLGILCHGELQRKRLLLFHSFFCVLVVVLCSFRVVHYAGSALTEYAFCH